MLKQKLKSRRGLTLSEMIVALAVFVLLATAVLSGILNAVPVYRSSVAVSEAQLLTSTLAQAISDELRYAKDIETEDDGTLKMYTSTLYGKQAKIEQNDQGELMVGDNPMIGSGSYTNLTANAVITYINGTFKIVITISQGSDVFDTSEFMIGVLNA